MVPSLFSQFTTIIPVEFFDLVALFKNLSDLRCLIIYRFISFIFYSKPGLTSCLISCRNCLNYIANSKFFISSQAVLNILFSSINVSLIYWQKISKLVPFVRCFCSWSQNCLCFLQLSWITSLNWLNFLLKLKSVR